MCRSCAGKRRHMAVRNGTRRTEGTGPAGAVPWGNTLLAFRFRVAVAHGNRTHRGRLSAPATGFEDRASHQSRKRYREGRYQVSSNGLGRKRPSVSNPGARCRLRRTVRRGRAEFWPVYTLSEARGSRLLPERGVEDRLPVLLNRRVERSEEHTSELQSL